MMRRHHTDTRLAQNILALADPRLSAAADLLADEDQLVTRVCRRMSGLLAAIPGFAGRSVSISPDTAKFRRTLRAARQQTRG